MGLYFLVDAGKGNANLYKAGSVKNTTIAHTGDILAAADSALGKKGLCVLGYSTTRGGYVLAVGKAVA